MQKKKKGFTLVELLVVIAILAILAGVSVVGYMSFTNKAKESNDVSLTDQMNTVLQANEALDRADTLGEAIKQIKEDGGVDLELITPNSKGYNYAWDKKQNRILLLNENYEVTAPANLKDEVTTDTMIIVKNNDQLTKALAANYGVGIASSYAEDITDFNLSKEVSLDNYAGKIKNLTVGALRTFSLERSASTNGNVYYSGVFDSIVLANSQDVKVYGEVSTLDVKNNTNLTVSANVNKLVVNNGTVNVVDKAVVDYVDASQTQNNVSINKTSNSTVGGVQAPENNGNAVAGNVSNVVVDKAPVTDFSGGLGTETSPYLIENIEQFKKINSYASTYNYYKLINSINIADPSTSNGKGLLNMLNGCLDGNDNYLFYDYNGLCNSIFKHTEINSIIKNLNVKFTPMANAGLEGAYIIENPYDSIVFDNVDLYGSMHWNNSGRNQSPYINQVSVKNTKENNVSFLNCNVNMDLVAEAYNAVFVGYIAYDKYFRYKSNFHFENCSFDGSFTGENVGILFGNNCNMSEINKIVVKNTVNNGELLGYTSANLAFANGSSEYDQLVINKNICRKLAVLDGFKVSIDGNRKINITKPTVDNDITSYKVIISQYVSWYVGSTLVGTDILSLEYSAESIAKLGDIYAYEFRQSSKEMATSVKKLAKYIIDDITSQTPIDKNISIINFEGNNYYYLDSNVLRPYDTGYVVITNPNPTVTVYAMSNQNIVSVIKTNK